MNSDRGKVVSWESEELILVDDDDTETGTLSKARAHDGDGVLHRAFSVFLFNTGGELLLQQRSDGKRLWPLYWSNSCCSHPRHGETTEFAVARRLEDELGITDVTPEFVFKFRYQARYGTAGSEHELCHVFLGRTCMPVRANPHEIAAVRWLPAHAVQAELDSGDGRYTPWFRIEWQRLTGEYTGRLAAYAAPAEPASGDGKEAS